MATSDLAPQGTLWTCPAHGYMARDRMGGQGLAHPRWDDDCYATAILVVWPGLPPRGWIAPRGMQLDEAGGWEAPGSFGEVEVHSPLLNSIPGDDGSNVEGDENPPPLEFAPPPVAAFLEDHPTPMADPLPPRRRGPKPTKPPRQPKDEDYATFCRRLGLIITQYREARGMSQAELTKALGCWSNMVSRWEAGASAPRADYLAKLVRLLGVEASVLLGVEGRFPH